VPILAVAAVDLYLAILTFEFGEAELRGSCGVVSFLGLRQEFLLCREFLDFAGTVFERSSTNSATSSATLALAPV
jgi:hypothetical protein